MLSFLCVSLAVPVVIAQTSGTISFQSSGTIYYAPPPDNPALSVVGTHLENGNGNTVYLVGAQVDWNERRKVAGGSSSASSPDGSWFTESDVQSMKAHGANYFEIVTISLKDLMPTRGTLNTAFLLTWIDRYCQWASNNQMYVTIDLASPSYVARWRVPDWFWQDAGFSQPTNQAEWDALVRDFFDTDVTTMDITRTAIRNLWAGLANRYKTNPYVLFSLFNEPLMGVNCIDSSTSQHLGETYSEFMEDIVDAIHGTGATNIIIVNVPYVCGHPNYLSNIQPVNRNGVIWEDHGYLTSTRDYSYWCNSVNNIFGRLVGVFNKPVIYGEYGFDPLEYGKTAYPDTWLPILGDMTNFLEGKAGSCGHQWHHWGALDGEYYGYVYDWYTASDSQNILSTVLGH